MCLVIDANVFCAVFCATSKEHTKFEPIKRWVTKGAGFIVYGGTKYKDELRKASKYMGFFTELSRKNKVKMINDQIVDQHQALVETIAGNSCDDHHIIAIFRASQCRLFCSNDKRADEHIKNRHLYPKGQKIPSIYRDIRHKRLLCKRNIVPIQNQVRP